MLRALFITLSESKSLRAFVERSKAGQRVSARFVSGLTIDDVVAIDEAEPALEAILKRWPGQPDALHYLGVLRHTQGRVDEAVSLIREALAAPSASARAGSRVLAAAVATVGRSFMQQAHAAQRLGHALRCR